MKISILSSKAIQINNTKFITESQFYVLKFRFVDGGGSKISKGLPLENVRGAKILNCGMTLTRPKQLESRFSKHCDCFLIPDPQIPKNTKNTRSECCVYSHHLCGRLSNRCPVPGHQSRYTLISIEFLKRNTFFWNFKQANAVVQRPSPSPRTTNSLSRAALRACVSKLVHPHFLQNSIRIVVYYLI